MENNSVTIIIVIGTVKLSNKGDAIVKPSIAEITDIAGVINPSP